MESGATAWLRGVTRPRKAAACLHPKCLLRQVGRSKGRLMVLCLQVGRSKGQLVLSEFAPCSRVRPASARAPALQALDKPAPCTPLRRL